MTAAANSIAGGLWGMGKGFQVGLWLVKFAVKYLLPSDARAYCRASSPVRQVRCFVYHGCRVLNVDFSLVSQAPVCPGKGGSLPVIIFQVLCDL